MELSIYEVVNWKVLVFIMILFIIINSDIFLENILSKLDKAVEGNCTTTYGTIIQSIIMGFGYMLIQPLASYGYV